MFDIAEVPKTRKDKVEFELLGDFGETTPHEFTIEVKVEDVPTSETTHAKLREEAQKDGSPGLERLFVEHYLVGIFDLKTGGKDFVLTPGNLSKLMGIHEIRRALTKKVADLYNRADLLKENSEG